MLLGFKDSHSLLAHFYIITEINYSWYNAHALQVISTQVYHHQYNATT